MDNKTFKRRIGRIKALESAYDVEILRYCAEEGCDVTALVCGTVENTSVSSSAYYRIGILIGEDRDAVAKFIGSRDSTSPWADRLSQKSPLLHSILLNCDLKEAFND